MKPSEVLKQIKSRLPHSTQAIIDIFGWEGSLEFLRQHGGQDIYMPIKYDPQHKLFQNMNIVVAQKLIERFGGYDVRLPSHKKMLAYERKAAIGSDYLRGLTITDLAYKYNCTLKDASITVTFLGVKELN